MRSRPRGTRGLPRLVWLLGFASLLNDLSSEAIFPLLPLYLAEVLPGGGMRLLGIIEGSADAVSSAVKVIAGRLSDRGPRRLLVAGGYALPALARAGIAAALSPFHVLAARLVDRVGKGIRSGPRDALLADAAPAHDRGRAFGLQRSMDHLGAALGPLGASAALALLAASPLERRLRIVFAGAAAVGLLAPLLLGARLRDPPEGATASSAATSTSTPSPTASAPLPPALRRYLALAAFFALGNSTDAFLLAKAHEVGWSAASIPLLWFGHHVLKTLTGLPGGALSDRVPRTRVVAAGWGAYALSYAGFALARTPWQVAAVLGFYAVYYGLAEGAERALVADLAGGAGRGRAYGWYYGLTGAAALPAGAATGWLWQARGSAVALGACAAVAGAAALLLTVGELVRARRRSALLVP